MVVNTGTHVIYSAVFGDYDNIIAPKHIHKNTDYVLFTDCVDSESIPEPWHVVFVDWLDTVDVQYRNRRSARHFKALPHVYMPHHVVSVWMDMTHDVVMNPHTIEKEFLLDSDIALFKHELRDCVYAEGQAVVHYKMDHAQRVKSQLDYYKTARYPSRNGLWETPGVVRRNTTLISKVNNLWWEMMCRYSSRDQISLPYILDKHKVKPHVLPGFAGKCSLANNKVIRHVQHHK